MKDISGRNLVSLLLCLHVLVLLLPSLRTNLGSCQTRAGEFSAVGDMKCKRWNQRSVLLDDGRVLVWESDKEPFELYDPKSRAFTTISETRPDVRVNAHREVVIAGKFTVTLGTDNPDLPYLLVKRDKLLIDRQGFTATLLQNGEILVAGGFAANTGFQKSAELYHPILEKSRATGSPVIPRDGPSALALNDGTVLFAGGVLDDYSSLQCGFPVANAEIYDPVKGSFRIGPEMCQPRLLNTCSKLQDGTVLFTGGMADHWDKFFRTAEIYDPATRTFRLVGCMDRSTYGHTATRLASGKVLIAGGFTQSSAGGWTETPCASLYDPASSSFTPIGRMHNARAAHGAIALQDGQVLITGGCTDRKESTIDWLERLLVHSDAENPSTSAEIYRESN